ncbi:MAG: GNAT family N-acetyltransferase [Aigarchaeota archaeon]|nr:GNAT family N-acetyltransferase [Aigarchaeota archaeon]MCX8193514.1 GNAT family N-acetyltransferase [Nitrososphaeria archaeon]MDW7986817.1 N-acetyltransferase [Nitrososphaerota archaeon]
MLEEVEIAFISENDLDEVYQIEIECFGEDAYPRWVFRYLLENSNSIFLKASTNNLIVGFIVGICSRRRCHLYTIDVRKAYRRRNIGSMLLEAFEREAIKRNVELVILQVEVNNLPALNLYLKRGYKIVKRIKNYYGLGRDAYEACKNL